MDLSDLPLDADPTALARAADAAGDHPWDQGGDASHDLRDARALRDGEPLVDLPPVGRVAGLPAYLMAGLPHAHRQVQVRASAAAALGAAAGMLPEEFGLLVLDAWRPLSLQAHLAMDPRLVEAGYVSAPSADPALAPPHVTGGTVDVTLTHHGVPLALGTSFDEFTTRAHRRALSGSSDPTEAAVDRLRRQLSHVMHRAGFVSYAEEWWHFELGTRRWAEVMGRAPLYGPVHVVEHHRG